MINIKKIKALMIIKEVTRKELSEKIGVTYQTVTKKFNGKTSFKASELKSISELLDVSINDLYNE